MDWDKIAKGHGTDKSSLFHDYMPHYETLLGDRTIRSLLEIGVLDGASLSTWNDLFPEATIVGVDIHEQYKNPAHIVVIANATDSAAMTEVGETYGPFDVIIDDGSHIPQEVEAAFGTLYRYLSADGIYVIEDFYDTDPWLQEFVAAHHAQVLPAIAGSLVWLPSSPQLAEVPRLPG